MKSLVLESYNELMIQLLPAARMAITYHGKKGATPSAAEWLIKVWDIY